MSCGTCGTPRGFERVWTYAAVGQETQEFTGPSAQSDAESARKANGKRGVVRRITRRVSAQSDARP